MIQLARFVRFCVFTCALGLLNLGICLADVQISEEAFRELAKKLAPKVTLFQDIWNLDPNAVFYGGTSRDFLYWILRKTRGASTQEELQKKIKALEDLEIIDIKEFMSTESDVDVATAEIVLPDPKPYGVRKIDRIDPKRLRISTPEGLSERDQGYIPVEKIEISQTGIQAAHAFGDGVKEMLTGNLTMISTDGDLFWNTIFAKQKLNHPLFLAIRYLRLRATHWNATHDDGWPDTHELFKMDPAIEARIRFLVEAAMGDPKFIEVIKTPQALEWLNGSIRRTFRSRTNFTAAYRLLEHFDFLDLQRIHPEIELINKYLFLQHRDPAVIEQNFKKYHTSPSQLFVPADAAFKDLILLHGTRDEAAYRAILFGGALPSEDGNAGGGLYGADLEHLKLAVDIAGSVDRVVKFHVRADAKVIDLTQKEGIELFEAWNKENPRFEELRKTNPAAGYDEFAKDFGADILKYSYSPYAFVVKNSAVLLERQGYKRQLLTVQRAIEIAEQVSDAKSLLNLLHIFRDNLFAYREIKVCLNRLPVDLLDGWANDILNDTPTKDTLQLLTDISITMSSEKKVNYLKRIFEKGLPLWNRETMLSVLRRLFYEFEMTDLEKDQIAHQLIASKASIYRSVFAEIIISNDLPASPAVTDKIMRSILTSEQSAKEVVELLYKRTDEGLNIEKPDYRIYLPAELSDLAAGWLDLLINSGMARRELISRGLLLFVATKGSDWFSAEQLSIWLKKFMSTPNPPAEITTNIHRGFLFINSRLGWKQAKSHSEEWLITLLQNPTISKWMKDFAVEFAKEYFINSRRMRFATGNPTRQDRFDAGVENCKNKLSGLLRKLRLR